MKRIFLNNKGSDGKKHRIMFPLCLLAFICLLIYINFFIDEPSARPKHPTESRKNKVILTSNGCCFAIKDINLGINSQESQLFCASADRLTEFDVFEYGLPDMRDENIRVNLSFTVFYGEDVSFHKDLLEMDADKLKDNGLLLYFQEHDDMYLNVVSGGTHITYKLGDEDDRWLIMDTPNTIYE